jgi:hypothetical protein
VCNRYVNELHLGANGRSEGKKFTDERRIMGLLGSTSLLFFICVTPMVALSLTFSRQLLHSFTFQVILFNPNPQTPHAVFSLIKTSFILTFVLSPGISFSSKPPRTHQLLHHFLHLLSILPRVPSHLRRSYFRCSGWWWSIHGGIPSGDETLSSAHTDSKSP